MEPDEIRQQLAEFRRTNAGRDRLVRLAYQAAIPIREIGQLSGLSRSTIYKILGVTPGDSPPLSASGGGNGD